MPSDTPPLTRRNALRLLSGTTLALMTGRFALAQNAPATTPKFDAGASSFSLLTPELTEGPFYIDLERIRQDITEGQPGVPLRLRIKVAHINTGAGIPNAAVDVWHCNATGVYSGFDSHPVPFGHPPGPPGGSPSAMHGSMPSPPPGGFPSDGPMGPGFIHKPDNAFTFLRGVQLTDSTGLAQIDTIFPGWYEGRTTHIHVRVHTGGLAADGRYQKGLICHTGQIFFPETTADVVYRLPAYVRKSDDRMHQSDDGIFRQGGSQVSSLAALDAQQPQKGFYSNTLLVVDPGAIPKNA